MTKTNIRKLTKKQKETIYSKEINYFILYMIYRLGTGSMLKIQLEFLISIFNLYKEVEVQIAIAELVDSGMVMTCQFAGTNKNYLYLSKYVIARMEGLSKSSQATAVRITDRGMYLNIFRVHNFILLLKGKNLSVPELMDILDNNGSTYLLKAQDALDYYISLYDIPYLQNEFTQEYLIDMNICGFEAAHSRARKKLNIDYNEDQARYLKEQRDKDRDSIPGGDRFFYNFNNLLLSNIVIGNIKKTPNGHTMLTT